MFPGFAASADYRWILYIHVAPDDDDIVLMETFR